MKRAQEDSVAGDLEEKFVFVAGPRQVGKTTLSRNIATRFKTAQYLNHDDLDDRAIMLRKRWDRGADLVILDEIHKHRRWKTLLKGAYDVDGVRPRILVTGSARLDLYRRGGDSMAGRYHCHRLLPLSLAELRGIEKPGAILDGLLRFGGFPEPFLAGSELKARRWRKTHLERIVREDVQDLAPVGDIQALLTLVQLLRERVGAPVSSASLARDLEVSPHTVKRWIGILETLYIVFRVTPWHRNRGRSLLKAPKIYFFDTGQVAGDEGARLENAVAVSLLKHLWFLEDTRGIDGALHYLRDREKREVDFLPVVDGRPERLIEVKTADAEPTRALRYYATRLGIPALQAVLRLNKPITAAGVQVRSVVDLLEGLEV